MIHLSSHLRMKELRLLRPFANPAISTTSRAFLRCSLCPSPKRSQRDLGLMKVMISDENGNSSSPGIKYILSNGLCDYYEVLGIDDDASMEEIKKAYRTLAKTCHPDFLGEEGHDICILLNEAYATLSDPITRDLYNHKLEQTLVDYEDDFTGNPLSKWMPTVNPKMARNTNPDENRAVFVDEFSCIGCKQCVWSASATFRMENEHGRSRVFAQWLDSEEKIQASIDSCPVNCIHWVERQDLPALEHVMQKKMTERLNVGVMMAGQGAMKDVFSETYRFLKDRKRREEALSMDMTKKAYSPAQEQARRNAAQSLTKNRFGWILNFESILANAFATVAQNVGGNSDSYQKVGKRKRAVKWDELERLQRTASDIPFERALVPIGIYQGEHGR